MGFIPKARVDVEGHFLLVLMVINILFATFIIILGSVFEKPQLYAIGFAIILLVLLISLITTLLGLQISGKARGVIG